MVSKKRPILLSLIALLEMLTGLLVMLMGGLLVVLSFGLLGEDFNTLWEEAFVDVFGVLFGVLAGAILFVGFLIFILGYGLWNLNYSAWIVTMILYSLNLLFTILNYEFYLAFIQTGSFGALWTPFITIVLFIYFLTIRDRFS